MAPASLPSVIIMQRLVSDQTSAPLMTFLLRVPVADHRAQLRFERLPWVQTETSGGGSDFYDSALLIPQLQTRLVHTRTSLNSELLETREKGHWAGPASGHISDQSQTNRGPRLPVIFPSFPGHEEWFKCSNITFAPLHFTSCSFFTCRYLLKDSLMVELCKSFKLYWIEILV